MNKRQKKKFKKKNRCKTYYGYRQAEIFRRISNHTDLKSDDFVYIIDSRRMDLKHFHKVAVLKNCCPIGNRTEEDDKQDQHEFTLEFTCNTYHSSDIDSVVDKMHKIMVNGMCDPKDIADTGTYDTYMTRPATLLADKLTKVTEMIPDIPDDRISKYLNDGFNNSKDNIERKEI